LNTCLGAVFSIVVAMLWLEESKSDKADYFEVWSAKMLLCSCMHSSESCQLMFWPYSAFRKSLPAPFSSSTKPEVDFSVHHSLTLTLQTENGLA
jgi:hypothetical protein